MYIYIYIYIERERERYLSYAQSLPTETGPAKIRRLEASGETPCGRENAAPQGKGFCWSQTLRNPESQHGDWPNRRNLQDLDLDRALQSVVDSVINKTNCEIITAVKKLSVVCI